MSKGPVTGFPPAPAIGTVREDGRVLREFSIRIPWDETVPDGFLERWVRWARLQGYEVVEARAFVQPSDFWALCVTTAVWLYPDDDRNPLGGPSREGGLA